ITVFSTVNTLRGFSRAVHRRAGAALRANARRRHGVDASCNACRTSARFEKTHETRCFLRVACGRNRTARKAAVHAAGANDASAQVYGDCRSTSGEPEISGAAQARLRKTAQPGRPSDAGREQLQTKLRPSRTPVTNRIGDR